MQQVQEKRIRQICIKLHKKWIEKEGYLQKTNKWVEIDYSGGAWVKRSDGCGDGWSEKGRNE